MSVKVVEAELVVATIVKAETEAVSKAPQSKAVATCRQSSASSVIRRAI